MGSSGINTESHTESVYSMIIVEDSKLNQIKNAFESISNVHVHSIGIKQSKEIKDFHQAQYQTDYEQSSKLIRSFISNQDHPQNKNKNNSDTSSSEFNRFGNIKFDMLKTVASPNLHRAIAPSKKKKDLPKAMSFDKKVEKVAEKIQKKNKKTEAT